MVSVVVGSVRVVWDVVAGFSWVCRGACQRGVGCGAGLGRGLGEGSCWTGHCCGRERWWSGGKEYLHTDLEGLAPTFRNMQVLFFFDARS